MMRFRSKQSGGSQKKLVRAREYLERIAGQFPRSDNPLRRLHMIINGDPVILRNLINLIKKYERIRVVRTYKLPLYRKYDNIIFSELIATVIRPAIDKYEQEYGELLVDEDEFKAFLDHYFKVITDGWTLRKHLEYFRGLWEKTLGTTEESSGETKEASTQAQ